MHSATCCWVASLCHNCRASAKRLTCVSWLPTAQTAGLLLKDGCKRSAMVKTWCGCALGLEQASIQVKRVQEHA